MRGSQTKLEGGAPWTAGTRKLGQSAQAESTQEVPCESGRPLQSPKSGKPGTFRFGPPLGLVCRGDSRLQSAPCRGLSGEGVVEVVSKTSLGPRKGSKKSQGQSKNTLKTFSGDTPETSIFSSNLRLLVPWRFEGSFFGCFWVDFWSTGWSFFGRFLVVYFFVIFPWTLVRIWFLPLPLFAAQLPAWDPFEWPFRGIKGRADSQVFRRYQEVQAPKKA